jgi:dTDP-4-dehydrorhamnose reductase
MKILITGSNGLLGQKLMRLLVAHGNMEITAVSRGKNRLDFTKGYSFASIDIADRTATMNILQKHRPDVIINTAAMTNVDHCELNQTDCWTANVTSVENLVAACQQTNSFLIHISTDFIFDGTKGPLTENAQPNPVNFYGESKLAAENVIMESNLNYAIARTVLVYGVVPDMSRSNIILWVKENLENGKAIKVVDDQWRTPTLAEDLAQGCYLIARKRARGVFNISGADMLTPYEMAMKVVDYFDLDGSLISRADSSTFSQPAKRPPKTGFIIEKAISQLGYQPHSFEQGIAEVASQLAAINNVNKNQVNPE